MPVSILDRRAARDYKRLVEPYALTPAVRAALAYIAITGTTAKGTQIDTITAAKHYAEYSDFERTHRFYTVPSRNLRHYESTPLWKVHVALLAAGFELRGIVRVRNGSVRLGKNVRYERVDADGNGFSAEVEPSGHLFGHVVKDDRDLWGRDHTETVTAKHAGTLPSLFSKAPQ